MSDNTNFKKHVCAYCISVGENVINGIKCQMTDDDITRCVADLNPGDD